jgi:hypothetical protein
MSPVGRRGKPGWGAPPPLGAMWFVLERRPHPWRTPAPPRSFGLRRAVDERQQLEGLVVDPHGVRRSSAPVAYHLVACVRQKLVVTLAPLGERPHCVERPIGITTGVLSQILSEVRDVLRSSPHLQRSHGIRPVPSGRGRHRHLNPPFSRLFEISHIGPQKTAGQRRVHAKVLVAAIGTGVAGSRFRSRRATNRKAMTDTAQTPARRPAPSIFVG